MLLTTAVFVALLVILFLGVLGVQVLGLHVAARRLATDPGPSPTGHGDAVIERSVFVLLGLLVAFTLFGGEARLNARRELAVQEANATATAYARLDLLPDEAQPMLREEFRRYLDVRLAYFEGLLKFRDVRTERRRTHGLEEQIWNDGVTAAGDAADDRASLLVLPAINAMIAARASREAALHAHVPLALAAVLVALTFLAAFLAGVGGSRLGRPSWIHTLAFALTLALTAWVILDLQSASAGLIRLDILDSPLGRLRAEMG